MLLIERNASQRSNVSSMVNSQDIESNLLEERLDLPAHNVHISLFLNFKEDPFYIKEMFRELLKYKARTRNARDGHAFARHEPTAQGIIDISPYALRIFRLAKKGDPKGVGNRGVFKERQGLK